MTSLLRLVIRNPLATALVAAVVALAGVYASVHMPVDLFPNLQVPVVNIITHYPGAAPKDMELLVSRPIEDEMRGIPGVRRVASISTQGISQVTAEFSWGATVKDARQLVQARLARVRGILPGGVKPRLENIGTTLQEVAGYVVYGGGDPITLRNIVRHDLASRLMGVAGVSSVEVLGGERRAFIVRVRPEALQRLRMTISDLVSVIKENDLTTVAGYLERSSREYLIRGDARLRTLEDLRSLPLASEGGGVAPLGSVAEVREGRAPRHYVVRADGVPAVALVIRKQPGASTIRVVRQVGAAMAELRGLLPPGTHVKKYYDQSEIIAEASRGILNAIMLGAVLAVLVLYFFLGSVRPTLIVAITIPLSLLATLAVMGLLGLSRNVITMTALTLAIGMVVDNAIVVTENVFRRRAGGLDTRRASAEGTAEVASAVAAGTFTTVGAFLPLILVSGLAALFLRPFGLTITAALLASLALSLTLVPVLSSRGAAAPARDDFAGARLLRLLNRSLQAALRFSFRHRWLTLALALLFLCMAALSAFLGRVGVLPPIDEGAILIEYVMPPGTSLSESNRIGDALDHIALADPDVSCVYRRTGSPETGYQIEGVNKGEIVMKLRPKAERRRSLSQIMAAMKSAYGRFSGVVFLYHQPTQEKIDESFSGLPALFGVTIYGPDVDTLVALGKKVEDILAADPAVANVVNNTRVKTPEVNVRVDYVKLARYGVRTQDVLATLRAARWGVEAARLVREKEDVAVIVRCDAGGPDDLEALKRLPVASSAGELVPLERIAELHVAHAPAAITRMNGQRQITLLAEVSGSIPAAVSRLRAGFRSLQLPRGYSIDFTGQYKVMVETALEMLFVLAAAIVLIYLIMAMQFRSWLQPLVILLTIPLSLVGALVALFLTRQGVDVSVGMGAVTLVGISVNNAIVLLDFSNRAAASGKTLQEALLAAASVRLRPIVMTALTTIFALTPIAVGTTVGSRIFQPFAITVIGGLISGTLATLTIVPTLAVTLPHPSTPPTAESGR